MSVNRRSFLGAVAASAWTTQVSTGFAQEPAARPRTLDLHVHLFGVGDNQTGCRMSPKITESVTFQQLVFALGLRKKASTIDEAYEHVLAEQVASSGFTNVAILGQDAAYDRQGKPDWERTSFHVPNDYVFDIVSRHPEVMIPCPSINPARADAVHELNRIKDKGARLFKIHPPIQGVDLMEPRFMPFFRRCADLGMIVMVHTGHEHSAPVINKHFAAPDQLVLALEQGCTVVACHAGSGWETDEPDQLPQFVALLDRYPQQLWGDTAVLGTAGRVRDFARLLKNDRVRDRLLHGSDYPFPVVPHAFLSTIGEAAVQRVASEPNWIQRDLALKQALGIGNSSAERAYALVFDS